MNIDRATELLQSLHTQGVREFCVCAGSRNSPLVTVLEHITNVKTYGFFEERSAAFFAIGRIKLTGRPVAVITTSGTAAAELLPAAIEAHYSGLALILLTADRPPHYRMSASPQTIEQVGLYSHYVARAYDLTEDQPISQVQLIHHRPMHINVCFGEPLLDQPVKISQFQDGPAERPPKKGGPFEPPEDLVKISRPLVVVGRLSPELRPIVTRILSEWGAPIHAEAPSGLRETPSLQKYILQSGEQIFKTQLGGRIDGIIRIGSVPTLRFWRDLETLPLPVINFSEEPFKGLSHGDLVETNVAKLSEQLSYLASLKIDHEFADSLIALDREQAVRLERLLDSEPLSEANWFRRLSKTIPAQSQVYLGNSLPIREWDLAASYADRGYRIEVNRGANGIDGQLSTFLGASCLEKENWGIFGDLTTLYDLTAPWVLPQLGPLTWRLIVINNFGGQIFSRLFKSESFINRHKLQFEHWAKMFGLDYECWRESPQKLFSSGAIIEVQPDAESSRRFWQAHGELWKGL